MLLHPTSHMVFLDCLRDGDAQVAKFQSEAEKNLPEFDVRTMGEMNRVLSAEDVAAALGVGAAEPESEPDLVSTCVVELPQRMNGGAAPKKYEL